MREDPKLAGEARQDQTVADADSWAGFIAAVERDARCGTPNRRLRIKTRRVRFD